MLGEVVDASVRAEVWLASGGTADSVEIELVGKVIDSSDKTVVWEVSVG